MFPAPKFPAYPHAERRSERQYKPEPSIQAATRHQIAFGRTRDLSSGGAWFATTQALSLGEQVELSIDWPMLLDGVCPLKLVLTGKVVRSDYRGAAVKTFSHEFRTRRGIRPIPDTQPGDSDRIRRA